VDFFDNPDLPAGQALNGAEYLSRGLRAELHNPGGNNYDPTVVREGCRRMLILAGRTSIDWQAEFGVKIIRLALMLIKVNGWQPTRFGGDGSIPEQDFNVDRADLLMLLWVLAAPAPMKR
jgi:hypothetical protein